MQNCEGCIHRHEVEPKAQCRRYPPSWQMVMQPGHIQGAMNIVQHVGFPPAVDTCGEYEMGIAASRDAE